MKNIKTNEFREKENGFREKNKNIPLKFWVLLIASVLLYTLVTIGCSKITFKGAQNEEESPSKDVHIL